MAIQYSLCWEDYEILNDALEISRNDKVLAIASGGENLFSILLRNPDILVGVDRNLDQIRLVELKVAAIKGLNYEEFVYFLGWKDCKKRGEFFEKCKKYLSADSLSYWEVRNDIIRKGVIHSGKFEAYLNFFRKFIFPFIVPKEIVYNYIKLSNLEEQRTIYKKWNSFRWRLLFKIFFSNFVLSNFARNKEMFKFNNKSISEEAFKKTERGIVNILIMNNIFMHYILIGGIDKEFEGHPYLDKKNFFKLKKVIDKLELVHSDIQQVMKKGCFSKFDFSDIFESMSDKDYFHFISSLPKYSRKNGIACYWNNFVERNNHPEFNNIYLDKKKSRSLFLKDRVFFYSDFLIERINNKN